MTGTSLDGIDAVLADFETGRPLLRTHLHRPLPGDLRAALLELNLSGADELHRAALAAQQLAQAYAAAVADLLRAAAVGPADVRAIGAHGQTVRHRPEAGYTVQINAPATLAELSGIDVVADFRSRDIAAGGQGAPLAPGFHAAVFQGAAPRAVVNIGGISNLTALPAAGSGAPVIGFDCGPGNMLIDAWASQHLGEQYDRDGRWASGGQVDAGLLSELLAEPFLALPPPKSTGRDLFNQRWLQARLSGVPRDARNVQATLTQFTATLVASAIERWHSAAADVVICGGGAFNTTLMSMLGACCAPRLLASSEAFAIRPDQVEALAFAWLAHEFMAGHCASLPEVTGARGRRRLGALYPH